MPGGVRAYVGGPAEVPEVDAEERGFRRVLDSIGLAAVILDRDGTISYCNEQLASLTGWAVDELCGRNWFETFAGDDRAQRERRFRASFERGDLAPHFRSTIRTRAGGERLIAWTNTPLVEHGLLVGQTSIGEDVTDRSRLWDEMRALLASSPFGVGLVDRDLRWRRINDALAAWSGTTAEERLGQRAGEGLPADVRREFEERVGTVFETGRQATFEGWVGDRDRRGARYAVAIAYPVQRGDEVCEAGVLVLDATGRRLAEEESAARALQQEVLARLATAATTRRAASALATDACEEVVAMLGVDCASALRVADSGAVEVLAGAGDLSHLVGPAIARAGRAPGSMVAAALASHGAIGVSDLRSEGRFDVPVEVVGAGISSSVLVGIRAERAGHGLLVANSCRPRAFTAADTVFLEAVAGVIASRLEREAAEDALHASEEHRREVFGEMLRATEEERARIATELHDDTVQVLTATLLAIDRMSAALERGDPERLAGATRTARATLTAAVDRTRRLMFELRPPLLEAHGVEPAVRDLAEQAGEEAGWEVETAFSVGRYPVALESLVYRTVQEAIANARKHAQAGRVRVELREEDGVLHGVVADDGRGFDKSRAMDRRLMRLHLGLDSMIERVQLAGGAIQVDTAPGHGTRILFSVPLDVDAPLGATVRAPRRTGPS